MPECAKDPEGDVYCGSHSYQPITRTLAAAAFRFDTIVIRSFATANRDDFTKQENYWMVEFLARTGCSAALAELLSAGMPAVAPEAVGHESEYGLEPIWLDPGLYMTPDTFDMVLGHALSQKVSDSDLHDMLELGICTYPASFVPILAKHDISLDKQPTHSRHSVPLRQRLAECGQADTLAAAVTTGAR